MYRLLNILVAASAALLVQEDMQPQPTRQREQRFTAAMKSLLKGANEEERYESVLLMCQRPEHCVDADLPRIFTVPAVLMAPNATSMPMQTRFNNRLLVILCLAMANAALGGAAGMLMAQQHQSAVSSLAVQLDHMRDVRVIVVLNGSYEPEKAATGRLRSLLLALKRAFFYNVIVLHRDFAELHRYHSYVPFAANVMLVETVYLAQSPIEQRRIFPDRLANLHGTTLVTLPDLIEPRTMLHLSAGREPQEQLGGYIGLFMRTFAERHNCTLRFPYPLSPQRVFYLAELRSAVRNGSLDVAASLSTAQRELNIYEYTYPLEIARWQTMLPEEAAVPTPQLLVALLQLRYCDFYVLVVLQVALLTLLFRHHHKRRGHRHYTCSDVGVRGLLGQPFAMPQRPSNVAKLLCMLLCLVGFHFTTFYEAQLSQLLTAPPTQPLVRGFDALLGSGLRIMISEPELSNLVFYAGEDFWQRYRSIFAVVKTYGEFQRLRYQLDTRYAYTITSSEWPIFAERQRYFARNIFRLSPDLMYNNFILFALPLNENSWFKNALNRFILRAQETGLLRYWYRCSFYHMVELGRFTYNDLSAPRQSMPLTLADFYWIWMLYGSANTLALLVFIAEQIHRQFSVKCRRVQSAPKSSTVV